MGIRQPNQLRDTGFLSRQKGFAYFLFVLLMTE